MKSYGRRILTGTIISVAIVSVALCAFWTYFFIDSRIPHVIKWRSESLSVKGDYYYVDLDQVEDLQIRNGDILIIGNKFSHFLRMDELEVAEVSKKLPGDFENIDTASHDWQLFESSYKVDTREYSFLNSRSGDRFFLELPRGSERLHFASYNISGNKYFFVIAAGDWKVGPPSYYGYFTVQRKP